MGLGEGRNHSYHQICTQFARGIDSPQGSHLEQGHNWENWVRVDTTVQLCKVQEESSWYNYSLADKNRRGQDKRRRREVMGKSLKKWDFTNGMIFCNVPQKPIAENFALKCELISLYNANFSTEMNFLKKKTHWLQTYQFSISFRPNSKCTSLSIMIFDTFYLCNCASNFYWFPPVTIDSESIYRWCRCIKELVERAPCHSSIGTL